MEYTLTRLDAALSKRAPFNGFAKATVAFNEVAVARNGRPVFFALGCDNLRKAR